MKKVLGLFLYIFFTLSDGFFLDDDYSEFRRLFEGKNKTGTSQNLRADGVTLESIKFGVVEGKGPVKYAPLSSIGNVMKDNRDTVYLIHGVRPDMHTYVNNFIQTVHDAFTHKQLKVVAIVYEEFLVPEITEDDSIKNINGAISVGQMFAKSINEIYSSINVYLIGEDLGNVVIASASEHTERPINYIYGINQRNLLRQEFSKYYLRQDMGNLVQTVKLDEFQYSYGHRNFFYSVPGPEYPREPYAEFAFCINKPHSCMATFCSNFDDYKSYRCAYFQTISVWNEAVPHYTGNFFFLK